MILDPSLRFLIRPSVPRCRRSRATPWGITLDIDARPPLAGASVRSSTRNRAAYLGGNDSFDRSISDFATPYADQDEHDHQAFAEAIRSGRLAAFEGA